MRDYIVYNQLRARIRTVFQDGASLVFGALAAEGWGENRIKTPGPREEKKMCTKVPQSLMSSYKTIQKLTSPVSEAPFQSGARVGLTAEQNLQYIPLLLMLPSLWFGFWVFWEAPWLPTHSSHISCLQKLLSLSLRVPSFSFLYLKKTTTKSWEARKRPRINNP